MSNYFRGTFDGNEKTVALDLDLSTSFNVGLFGSCGSGSVIKNVTTTGTVKGMRDVAGIAGNANGKIINCHNGADVTGSNSHVGGISGFGSKYVINCSNSGAVNGREYVGGIIGNMSTAYIINCLNTGSVTGKKKKGEIAGGAWTDEITNCVNNGKIVSPDNYAGGISTHYQFNGKQLALAKEKINHLIELTGDLYASDMHELMFIYELKERLTVCLSVIAHLGARKETRWHSFAENLDYPDKSDDWMKYVNSRYENGQLHMIYRELVGREARYEHND